LEIREKEVGAMLARWAPFDLLDREAHELIRRTFGDFGTSPLRGSQSGARAWAPAVDAFLREGALHVRVEAPGIDPDTDVDIEVADGVLKISGERRMEQSTEENGSFRREMTYGHFERSFALPDGVDGGAVRASYDAGILHVTVPLPEKPRSKVKVEIGQQDREAPGS
jgi:HSP20 family protein